jgi:peptide/nickel transport system substrate-binding protein
MLRRLVVALLLLVTVAAAGCAKPNQSGIGGTGIGKERAVDGGTLNLALPAPPQGLFHPLLGGTAGDRQARALVYSGLLRLDDHLQPVCDLCETYTVSPDNRTITFTLRSGVKWHDGEPFTAADVAYTFRMMLHPAFDGPNAHRLAPLKGVAELLDERDQLARQVAAGSLTTADGASRRLAAWSAWSQGAGKEAVSVVDDRTVTFTLNAPYGPFLTVLTQAIAPEHIFRNVDPFTLKGSPAVAQPVGTGPYKVVEFKPGEFVRLERNETYHLGKPHVTTVVMRVVKPEAVAGELAAGRIDWAPVTAAAAGSLAGASGVRLVERPALGYQYLGLNQDLPLFADVRVRQALLYGINRQGMVQSLLQGHGTVVNSHMVPGLWAQDPTSLEPYAFDPKKAADLLAEAGWTEKNAEGYLVRDGKTLGFTLKYPAGNRLREASAPLIRDDLKQIGIKVTLEKVEFAQLVEQVFAARRAEAWLLGWDLSLDPDPGPQLRFDNKWGKATGWTNARAEALLQQGVGVITSDGRKQIYGEWDRIVNSEVPFVFLYAENELEAVREQRVQGWKPGAGGTLWNIYEWWIPKALQ